MLEGGRVRALGQEALAAGAPRRDLPGLWLAPAPLDAHVHLHLGGTPAANLAAGRVAGLAALRDLGHPPRLPTPLAKEPPPLLRVAGPALGAAGPGGSWLAEGLAGAEAFAQAVAARVRAGAGVIKLFASGLLDFAQPGQVLHPLALRPEEMRAAVKAAGRAGLSVTAHASGEEAVRAALAAGVQGVEHGFFLGRQALQEMASRGVSWSPTLAAVRAHAQDPEGRHDPAQRQRLQEIADRQAAQIRLGVALGVRLVLGSDAGSYGLPHGRAAFLEMEAWLEAGVAPELVFQAATSQAAQALGLAHELGGVFPGARAWLLACAGDPRQDPLLLARPAWRSF
ncbi:MAG: amidohydrolase family protein [Thermodesulfobacteriota bacterium]